jgi:hypothetical protein
MPFGACKDMQREKRVQGGVFAIDSCRKAGFRSAATGCWLLLATVALVSTTGCGSGDPFERQPLKGFITWEGEPIQFGSIALEPAEGQPAGAMASIRDGVFEISREAGPSPGKYSVWLHAYDHSGERPADGSEIEPPKEILPQQFLAKAPAEVTIERVSGSDVNEFTFDLKE